MQGSDDWEVAGVKRNRELKETDTESTRSVILVTLGLQSILISKIVILMFTSCDYYMD